MPIYEYECSVCHLRFERRQSFSDEPVTSCPECQGKSRRVIHSTPVIFKGSGFYVTENRKGGEAGAEKSKKEVTSKGEKEGK